MTDSAKGTHLALVIILPCIIYIGIIGNIFAIFLFINSRLKVYPSSQFLGALALSDCGFLLTLQGIWLEQVVQENVVLNSSNFWCKSLTFLAAVCDMCSVWLLVAVSVERFLLLCFPTFSDIYVTVKTSRITIGFLILFGLAFCSWIPITTGLTVDLNNEGPDRCYVYDQYFDTYVKMNLLDSVFSCFVPAIIILPLNLFVATKLWRITKLRQLARAIEIQEFTIAQSTSTRRPSIRLDNDISDSLESNRPPKKPSRHVQFDPACREKQHTKLLVLVTTLFILFNLPSYILRLLQANGLLQHQNILELISYLLYYSHHAIAFYIYAICSPSARHELIVAAGEFRWCCKFRRKNVDSFQNCKHSSVCLNEAWPLRSLRSDVSKKLLQDKINKSWNVQYNLNVEGIDNSSKSEETRKELNVFEDVRCYIRHSSATEVTTVPTLDSFSFTS